ncbi:Suppressor of RPS4-RLD 1 [Sesamum angolense]|uniref:Suppressor of RPS4-RLD 1 n=1 Tax=Sesamum angolense TaxID=2727404 RepID=A0AAE2BPW0_9LAMI|nr:Suppressor of RPS4-RLD 1 [Sesamum angolense]
MAPAVTERMELAKLCSSKDWSKAIRVLDSLLSKSCAIQDLCNRAYCYSQLELHKHVIKDCDKALQLDPKLLQAYILKGRAFSALGRKEEALSVWEQGYEHAVCQCADLKQLLELEDLLRIAKQNGSISCQNHVMESSGLSVPASGSVVSTKASEISYENGKSNGKIKPSSKSSKQLEAHDKLQNGSSLNVRGDEVSGSQSNKKHESHSTKTNGMDKKLAGKSMLNDSSESMMDSSVVYGEPSDFSDICSESFSLSEIQNELMDEANKSKKFCVARISKNKSINVDFRLSRGIAQVNDGKYAYAISIFDKAIADLTKALEFEPNSADILHERDSIMILKLHAGIVNFKFKDYKAAVEDLSACVEVDKDNKSAYTYLVCESISPPRASSPWYGRAQKEIALYTASKFNTEFSWFDLDGDIDPLFKEYWCKKLHPKNVCEKVYRQPPLRDSLRKGKLKKQEFSLTKQKAVLLHAADSIGKKIQYHCPGFLPNRRQYRMAGLAAIEIAQKVVKVWRSLQNEWKHSNKGALKHGKKVRRKEKLNPPSQNRGGAGCSTSSFLEPSISCSAVEDRSYGRPTMPWHSLYSLAVKWRQISEPCDPVVWVNKLSEEFNSGFGSHTPLILGQAKVVRYFPNFQRALNVAKAVIKDNKYVRDKNDNIVNLNENGKLQEIMNAESCSDLYKAVGQDFWLATWCNSMAFEGKRLEGTRICLVKADQIGHDFAIRTPCTPSRWEDFEVEMTSAWEALCEAYCGENYGSTDFDVLENVRQAILRMTYYWYNFMPLSRGTAVVGFVVLLGLLLAANMEFTGSIPEGVQVDWEAILEPDPNSFLSSMKTWLCPSLKINTSWKGYPDVASTLETTGLVVAALSTYSD